MQRHSIQAIIDALNEAGVRYLVAGGLAVVAHGHVRFTADLDLVLDLEEGNIRRAIRALTGLGYRPRAPVEIEQFADATARAAWVRDKGMTVFSLSSPQHAATEIDLFVEPPLDFERAYASAALMDVAAGTPARFVSLEDLIAMKAKAGRPQDLADIEKLQALRRDRDDA
jgi:Nucleotidyl transferase AbiEii toxin, Type IV TA system